MDEDYQPERRRGRAPGKKKNPISVEERRARNAQYERERRDGTAEAMRHLAEAAGCLPSMPNKVILQTACHQLVQYRSATDEVTALKQTNDTIIAEIVHLKNFLAKGKKAKKDKKKKRSLDSNKSSNHGVKICNKNEKKKKNRKTKTKSPTTEMEPANSNITQEFVQQSSEVNTSVEVDASPDSGIYEPDLFPLCDDWPLEPASWALPLEDPFNGGPMELGQLFEEMESPYIEQGEVEVQNPVEMDPFLWALCK
ncbi:uncharacterized protein LOC128677318 [Plodia interpunctella]|uniref:uncharacterized protein LOC128677318 n=1 Tax=Plodia interpunctella TaxID=58824 RepID=UPI00236842E8|nr:uncharacterized protein LOC128677318 [Plodia interpunctella]